MKEISIFWFRRDLRLENNTALKHALDAGLEVLPLFIFDEDILEDLANDDPRISFIYDQLNLINKKLQTKNSSLLCVKGRPYDIWLSLIDKYQITQVYTNKDYEPYARERDETIKGLLSSRGIQFHAYKDQVIFEENEITKEDGNPYRMFTPYKHKWLKKFNSIQIDSSNTVKWESFIHLNHPFPSLKKIGFKPSTIKVRDFDLSQLGVYAKTRDYPAVDATSYLSPHLRFGTLSIRQVIAQLTPSDDIFLSELIWREFFMQILYHYPKVVSQNFKPQYDYIQWNNNEADFKKWCEGKTGYPLVDAGMRQLNETAYMHNRVRMVCASFLCKHLLIDWRWGESYFAQKLLDYELSSNNGNWQWVAGTGSDSAPYFRIFNPSEQLKKFDKDKEYVKKWVPEYGSDKYQEPMIENKFARNRTLAAYKKSINRSL